MTAPSGTLLENLTWVEARDLLTADTVVVIPLGAAAKEHGPHLKLNNDQRIADFVTQKVMAATDVVVAPAVPFSYYPAFVEYPGSISLSLETASNLIVEICCSLARFGPCRFYVINIAVSTAKALAMAANRLSTQGILLNFTNFEQAMRAKAIQQISEQEGGSHADEIETSMMLYIAPDSVDMSQSIKDFDQTGSGPLSPIPRDDRTHSPSGIWGDATLATVSKGETVVKSLVLHVLDDIARLRQTQSPPAGCNE